MPIGGEWANKPDVQMVKIHPAFSNIKFLTMGMPIESKEANDPDFAQLQV